MDAWQVSSIVAAARAGKVTGLQPNLTAHQKAVEAAAQGLRQAVAALVSIPGVATAAALDSRGLQAAFGQLTAAEQAGNAGILIRAVQHGAANCEFQDPQVAVIISKHDGAWGHTGSPALFESPVFAPRWKKSCQAFALHLGQQQLQQGESRLSPLDHVQLRQPEPMPLAAAAVLVKPKPLSKTRMTELRGTYLKLNTFLSEQGTVGCLLARHALHVHACATRWAGMLLRAPPRVVPTTSRHAWAHPDRPVRWDDAASRCLHFRLTLRPLR